MLESAIVILISLYIITSLFSLVSLVTIITTKDFYSNKRLFIIAEILKTAIVTIITAFLIQSMLIENLNTNKYSIKKTFS